MHMRNFWSAQQQFFRQLLICSKVDATVKLAEAAQLRPKIAQSNQDLIPPSPPSLPPSSLPPLPPALPPAISLSLSLFLSLSLPLSLTLKMHRDFSR